MTIVFDQMPNTNRVPGPYSEIDGSKAVSAQGLEPHHTLLIGIRRSTGTAAEGQVKSIVGELDGDAYFAANSMLGGMCRAYKRLNKSARCSAMALDEAAGGTAATGTFPLVGTATADGTLRVRIGDTRVSVAVSSGTAANTALAVALAAAINAEERLVMSATSALGTVTITCRHKGEAGNAITTAVELLPAGITCTPVQPSGGATNPTMSTAIAALDEERYDTIVIGMTDATSVAAVEAEIARRWGPLVKQPGMAIGAVRGTHGTLTTYGSARNSQFSSIMGTGLSPTPPWIWAAQVAARDALRCDTMPNRPRNGLTLPDCEAPAKFDRFDATQRNLLMYDGISTYKVDQSGNVLIERLITTYQTNAAGVSDVTYLAMETQRNLAALYLESLQIAAKYGDYVLVPDADAILVDSGVPALSPKAYKGELIAWYGAKVKGGRCYDLAGFIADLKVEIRDSDHERLDTHMLPRLTPGVVTVAHKISFML